MKQYLYFLMALVPILIFGANLAENPKEVDPSNKAVNSLINKVTRDFESSEGFATFGVGISMPDGIVKKLSLDFQIKGPLPKDQLRRYLVESSQKFLNYINSDLDIRPFLESYPCTEKNVSIALFIIDKDRFGVDDPNIGIASIQGTELNYITLTPSPSRDYHTQTSESLEDALKMLNEKVK